MSDKKTVSITTKLWKQKQIQLQQCHLSWYPKLWEYIY